LAKTDQRDGLTRVMVEYVNARFILATTILTDTSYIYIRSLATIKSLDR
jgi:hypothetical protein